MRTARCKNPLCGVLILYSDLTARRYCSNKCRQQAYRLRKGKAKQLAGDPFKRYCVNCGNAFMTYKLRQQFCRTSCRVSFHQQQKRLNNSESVEV